MTKRLTILHTNDLHGRYERWLKQAALIRSRKAELEAQGDLVLLVDAGDHMDFSIDECMATHGHLHVQMLAELGVQAFVPGNNELLRTTVPLIRELSLNSEVPWLLTNLRDTDGSPIGGMLDTLLLDLGDGVKVGLTGITDLFEDSYECKHGFTNRETMNALQEAIDHLRAQGATLLILLSHLGALADQLIAEALAGQFDLIIGGHSHTVIEQPREQACTFIVQAGALGQYVGEVTLELEEETGRLFSCTGFLHPVSAEMADDPTQAALLREARVQAESFFDEVLTTLERPLTHAEFVTLTAESLRQRWEAEIGLMVGAAALGGLPAGPISRGMVFQNCRSMILPVKTEIRGEQLLQLIHESCDPEIYERNVYGNGIRPNPLPIGKVYFAGVTWQESDGQVADVCVNGEPLAAERLYVTGLGSILLYPEMGYYTALQGCPLLDRETFVYSKDLINDFLRSYHQEPSRPRLAQLELDSMR